MAPPADSESAQSTHPKAKGASRSTQRVVPAIPLSFARPSFQKKGTNISASNLSSSSSSQPSGHHEHEVNGDQATGPKSTLNTEDQLSSESVGIDDSTGINVQESVNEEVPAADFGQQLPVSQHGALGPDASSEPPHSAPLDQTWPQEPPPQFYPPGGQSTPLSAASSNFSRVPGDSIPSFLSSSHHSRPSANGIVFGGYADSTSSSPAPPVHPANFPYPPPLPNLSHGNQMPPIFVPTNHSHRFSEPHLYAGYVPAPNAYPYGPPHFYRQPMFQVPPPPLYPEPSTQWVFAGGQMPYQTTGGKDRQHDVPSSYVDGTQSVSRPTSAVSSMNPDLGKPHVPAEIPSGVPEPLAESREATDRADKPDPNDSGSYRQRSTIDPPRAGQPDVTGSVVEDPSSTMRKYLCSQFGNGEFADYILTVTHVHNRFPPLILPVHGILLSRSPTMAQLIKSWDNFTYSEDGKFKMISVLVDDRFIDRFAFSDVLRYLYGDPVTDIDHFTLGFTPPSLELGDDAAYQLGQRTTYAFAYIASGFFLQLENVTTRGVDIAVKLLRWETVEKALSFALAGGLGPNWNDEDSAEDHDSVSSSEDSHKPETSQSSPTYGVYATRLLQNITDFLVDSFPKDFLFDPNASQLKDVPRLPVVVESRPSTSDPRLSKIQFGEVPMDEVARSSRIASTLSSVLLSLPFPVLKSVLEHHALGDRLSGAEVVDVMKTVIDERERRRSRVLKARVVGTDYALLRNVRWEEKVEASKQHHAGYRMVRHRTGVSTPVSGMSSKS